MEQSVVSLIFRANVCLQLAFCQCRLRMKYHNARQSVRAVHQRGRTLQYLYWANAAAVNLHAVLVAPLLSLLAHTLAHHYHAVVSQSANDRFRYAAACRQLAYTWLTAYGIHYVCRRSRAQHLWCYYAHWRCRVFQLCVARHARNHQLVQLQVTEENVCRVLIRCLWLLGVMLVLTIILSCHCRAYKQQWQNDDVSCFHSVI